MILSKSLAAAILQMELRPVSLHVFEGRIITRRPQSPKSAARRVLAGLLIATCGWVAFAVYSQVAHGETLSKSVQQYGSQNDVLRQEIADRQLEISQAQTQAWLEEEARKLGYVMPGEKVYVLTTPGAALPAGGGVVAPLPTFQPTPAPGAAPGPTPTPVAVQSAPATPTPYQFILATPPPR